MNKRTSRPMMVRTKIKLTMVKVIRKLSREEGETRNQTTITTQTTRQAHQASRNLCTESRDKLMMTRTMTMRSARQTRIRMIIRTKSLVERIRELIDAERIRPTKIIRSTAKTIMVRNRTIRSLRAKIKIRQLRTERSKIETTRIISKINTRTTKIRREKKRRDQRHLHNTCHTSLRGNSPISTRNIWQLSGNIQEDLLLL
mmetsp:Transcript_9896/g.7027  ORF Transcript_9896/g.7027 Transcript_9896/m.7027 type:complete len:201 (+) Transcript_9896:152-754(+)